MNNREKEEYIKDNIIKVNNGINSLKNDNINVTEVKNYLHEKIIKELEHKKDELVKRFKEENYKKASVKEIANEYVYYKGHLESFYDNYLYKEFMENVNEDVLLSNLLETIKDQINEEKAYHFIRSDLTKLGKKLLFLLKQGGFQTNLQGLNQGVMVANSGDSAQFLFLSRAILAGYNCSNVDVRSSRYDAIIDFEGSLLKVQVKGISDNIISFKDRDRGGQGIDYTHERNRGRFITSDDCDIYVAVDKQCGICYLIPMSWVDTIPEEGKVRVNVDNLLQFKENWNVIRDVAIAQQK